MYDLPGLENTIIQVQYVRKTIMCGRTIFLLSLIILLGPVAVGVAELVAYWPLDEDIGGITPDKAGNGLYGTLVGDPDDGLILDTPELTYYAWPYYYFRPTTVRAGDSWQFECWIENWGYVDAGPFSVQLFLAAFLEAAPWYGAVYPLGEFRVPGVSANSLDVFYFQLPSFPDVPCGQYFVGLVIDLRDEVLEMVEYEDNEYIEEDFFPLIVHDGSGLPDLRGDVDSLCEFDPASVTPGADWTSDWRIHNGGSADAGVFWVDFYASADDIVTGDDYYLGSELVEGVPAGSWAFPFLDLVRFPDIPSGSYYVGVLIDSWDHVPESDESNNMCVERHFYPLTVYGGPVNPRVGFLQVIIEPQEVVDAGAQWRRVGTLAWRDSGHIETGLSPGQYTVEFKDVIGYVTPNEQTGTLDSDGTLTFTASYAQADGIPINIPTLVLPIDGTAVLTTPTFQLFSSAADDIQLQFKIEILKNEVVVKTFDQTQDTTNWDKTDYASNEIATFNIAEDQALTPGVYQWRAYTSSNGQWSPISQTWSFVTIAEQEQLETEHFIIKYTTNSLIPWHIDDITYAYRVAEYMEAAYEFFVNQYLFQPGWSTDSNKYKVWIGSSFVWSWGIWGELRSDGYAFRGNPLGTYVTVAHNLQPQALKLTCFHEYFHTIQHSHHRFMSFGRVQYLNAPIWIIEGNARAIEYIAPGYPTDFSDGLGTATRASSFRDYLEDTPRSIKAIGVLSRNKDQYRSALYWYFLMRNTKIEFDGNRQLDEKNSIENITVINMLWDKLHEFGPNDSWDDDVVENALDAALGNAEPPQYRNFNASFIAFAKANFIAITKPNTSEEQFYPPDAASSIQTFGRNLSTLESVDLRSPQSPMTRNVENYGIRYFNITNANEGNQLQIAFDGDDESAFFTRIYPAGDIGREDTITDWDVVTFPIDDAIDTVVIVGRLNDNSGSGDFSITFRDISQ